MHRSAPTVAVAVLLVAGLAGCSSTRTAGEQISDTAITSNVKARLAADPEVNPFTIDVDTRDGVVRLSGRVRTEAQRAEAVGLARRSRGVRRVIDDLEVHDASGGQPGSDAWIALKIKAKLTADPDINPFDVDVDVDRGVVTLTGAVPSEYDRDHAAHLASNTRGVVRVENRLEVEPRR